MPRSNRRDVLTGIGAGLTVGLAGCTSEDGTETEEPADEEPTDTETPTEASMDTETEMDAGTANVRVAHLSPDAPNVDVFVGGDRALADVPFRAVSDYLEVPAGTLPVEITAAGDPDTVAFAGDLEVAADAAYTVAAVGELSSDDSEFRPLVLEDDVSVPADDTARVRVVHASPDAPAVDVTVAGSGDAIVDGAAFGDAAAVDVPAGTYTLQVRPDTEGNDGDVVAEFTVELAGGTAYTAFAGGYLTPGDDPADAPFDLTVAVDAGAGGGGVVETADLRVAHLSPDAPNVDVYVDDERALADVPFRAVSDYLAVPAGSRAVEITAAGDPDTVAFSGDVELAADAAYTVAAVGELSSEDSKFRPLVLEDDLSDPGDGTARVRVVHASPDAPAVDVTVAGSGDAIVDGAAFGDAAAVDVPAGDYTLQVRPDTESNDGDVVAEFDLSLAGNTAYTAFAGGYLTPDDEPSGEAFDLTVAVDSESGMA